MILNEEQIAWHKVDRTHSVTNLQVTYGLCCFVPSQDWLTDENKQFMLVSI